MSLGKAISLQSVGDRRGDLTELRKNTGRIAAELGKEKTLSGFIKLSLIAVIFMVHVAVWQFVNHYNALRPASGLNDLKLAVDEWIPYLGWTWPIYYSAHFFITIGGSLIIWRLERKNFIRIIVLIGVMITTAGMIQLILPAQSPLPGSMNSVHRWVHSHLLNDPYVCFPSLHVALTALPAFVGMKYFKGFGFRSALCLVVLLISISTVTLKEHYVADTIAGGLYALIFFAFYNLI